MPVDRFGKYFPPPQWWPDDVDEYGYSDNVRFAVNLGLFAVTRCKCKSGCLCADSKIQKWVCDTCHLSLTIEQVKEHSQWMSRIYDI